MTPNYDTWLATGLNNRWITKPTCMQHDSTPMTREEEEATETGHDPCIYVLRIVETHDIAELETNTPEVFRW